MDYSDISYSDLDIAKYTTVHEFAAQSRQRGAAALAPLIGLSAAVLCNKVNPNIDTHHLTLDEAVRIQAVTRNFSIHEACDRLFGRVSLPALFDYSGVKNEDLTAALLKREKEAGETAAAIELCLDGEITPDDLRQLQTEIYQDIQVLMEILHRVQQQGGAQ